MQIGEIGDLLKLVDKEVWVVTAAASGRRGGLLATWVSAASIDAERPVMLVGLAPNHHTNQLVEESGVFALHLLAPDQGDVAWNFALGSGRDRDKLEATPHVLGDLGCPLLETCLGWLECRVFARLDAGDRIFYWADVVAGAQLGTGEPLREHALLASASDRQREQLRRELAEDIARQRPGAEQWRQHLPAELLPSGGAPPDA